MPVATETAPVRTLTDQPRAKPTPALAAYESLACFYDDFTAEYLHEDWLSSLAQLLAEHGSTGKRLLDVACGTGKSAAPMLARGYDVTACDLSPSMVQTARRRLGMGREKVFVADMRDLPDLRGFDVVTCLDDAVNYLLEPDELTAAFAGMRRALRPGGLLVFDTNSLATYEAAFCGELVRESEEARFHWRGVSSPPVEAGGIYTAVIDIRPKNAGPGMGAVESTHVQRHHPLESIVSRLRGAGLRLRALRGQLPGGRLYRDADERRHVKLVYLAERVA